MSDDKTAEEAQAAKDAEAQAAKDKAAAAGSQEETFTAKDMQKVRNEAAGHRTRANDLEAQLTAAKDAATAATTKAEQDVAAALAVAKKASIEATVVTAASRLGFKDPDDAVKLIDGSKVTFEDGKVGGVKEALDELAKNKPHLLGTRGAGDGPDRHNSGAPADMNDMIRKQAGVTPE